MTCRCRSGECDPECDGPKLRAEIESAMQLSHEWMAKHDRLLAFIQARPEMLTELIAEKPKP